MNKLSRIISLILVAIMSFSLVACAAIQGAPTGESGKGDSSNTSSDNSGFSTGEALFNPVVNYEAIDLSVQMESSVDSFTLLDSAYLADESFVYTATVSFASGVAAGLAFGVMIFAIFVRSGVFYNIVYDFGILQPKLRPEAST